MGDLRFSLRSLRKNPTLAATAIVTLALGSGANTAIFSVVKAVLLNSLPYRDPSRVVAIAETAPDMPDNQLSDAFTAEDWRTRSRSLASMGMYGDASGVLVENGQGEIIRGLRVTSGFFGTLGVTMQLGRDFLPEEDQPDRKFTVVILSHGLWMRRFGGDPHIIGRTLDLTNLHYRVVGVLPRNFAPLLHGTTELLPEIYMPAGIDYSVVCRKCLGPRVIARIKAGVTLGQARAELNTIMREIVREHAADYSRETGVSVTPMRDFLLGRVSLALWAVLGSAGFVLLIACLNVANLLLARATSRAREIATRTALGAGRWDLMRQLLIESMILAGAGGLSGMLLALAGSRALASLLPAGIPRVNDVAIDGVVMAFNLGATFLTALLCGLAPDWRATRVDLNEALKASGKATGNRSRFNLRSLLITAELALSFVLIAGAGLMAKSYLRLTEVSLGFDPRHILTLSSSIWGRRYDSDAAMLNYYEQALNRLHAIPGVEGAAWTSRLPLDSADLQRLRIEGHHAPSEAEAPLAETYSVSADYFQVMKIALMRGRWFTTHDRFDTPRVAVISENCARTQFPSEDPIGKRIRLAGSDSTNPWATIVGVVGDIRQYGLDRAPNMEVYMAQSQDVIIGYYRLVARTAGAPLGREQQIRAALVSVDSLMPVYHVKALDDYLAGTLAPRMVTLALLGLFSALALMLAAVGVYGVISHVATQRTREVGIRMALGAERRDVLILVLRQGLASAGIGLVVGFLLSRVTLRLLQSLLFEVRPDDWASSAAAMAVLASVALAATYLPAHRSASLDPMIALREE